MVNNKMKKICFIALALLFSMAQSAWADTAISWADHIDASWGSDYDTSNAFTISTPAQLAKFAYMVSIDGNSFKSKTVILTEDIDLSEHYWNPIGGIGEHYFSGIFDGDGHTISGMNIINDEYQHTEDLIDECKGLFGYINDGARIKNLKITDSSITTVSYITGAIVGYAENCIIENCSVDSTVDILSNATQPGEGSVDIATGGLVGILHYGSAELWGCVCGASVSGREKVGGLVGEVVSAHVVACLYTGSSVNGGSSTTQAALFGNINGGQYLYYNLYTNSALDGKNGQDKRGYVISLHPQAEMSFDFGTPTTYDVSGISYYTYNNYPADPYSCIAYGGSIYCAANQRIQINITTPLGYVPTNVTASAGTITDKGQSKYELYTNDISANVDFYANSQLTAWNGDGTGTEANPYLVKTPDDLRWIAVYSNVQNTDHYEGKFFQLANDIEFDGTENNFTPIAQSSAAGYYFAGTFDGQNHTISGINMSGNGRQGLFGTIAGATIKNLTLSASTFNMTNNSAAGGIVAYVKKGLTTSTIENCHVTSDVNFSTQGITGGIAGEVWSGSTDIRGCTSAATIELSNNNQQVGGIVGHCGYTGTNLEDASYVTVSNCLYYGTSLRAATNCAGYIGAIFGGYYENENYQRYSVVSFSENYYTYPDASVMAVGLQSVKYSESTTDRRDLDLTVGSAAVRAHVVSASADISDMGTAGTPVVRGVTPYTYGIKFGDAYYSHVLALENAGDYTTALQDYDGQTFNVKLRGRRLFKDGSWNTICLPFSLNGYANTIFLGDDCEVQEMNTTTTYYVSGDAGHNYFRTGCNDGRLYLFFNSVNSISAGVPYIVKWEKVDGYNELQPAAYDHLDPMFSNVTIEGGDTTVVTSKDGTVSFTPTYAPFSRDYADRSILFVGAANRLYYPNGAGNVSVKSFRAYFQLNGVQMVEEGSGDDDGDDDDYDYIPEGGGMVKPFIINIEEDATSLNEELRMNNEDSSIYKQGSTIVNLAGQRLSKAQKGINIVNGKKVLK